MTQNDWLTVSEIAAATKFHPSTVTRWILDGQLEAHRIGYRAYRVSRRAWEAYLERQRAAHCGDGSPSAA
jgi:excisionase family DNA binding protein